ncbi:hypothetical protein [Sphingobacterium corticibacter]|uniref:hypothetical protein n=1 Tax=Sphingobacterium corticibacter TaxID=2171749 RepID=UPI0013FDF10A|nr:hypothetical protein [Sphingobacterium corticibacter]
MSCSKDDGLGSNYQVTYVLEGPAVVAQVQYTPTIMRRVMRRFQRQLMLEQFWVN